MAMTPEQVADLDARAQEVGAKIGWRLRFLAAANPEYVALVGGPDQVVIKGPAKLADMAAHDIDFTLDELERGDRRVEPDEDGDPRIV
jgi:hypothetical protein